MRLGKSKNLGLILLAITLLTTPGTFYGAATLQSPPNIGVNGYVSGDNVRRGRSAQAVVEMNIPAGFHVNSNRPLEKFLIPTKLEIEAPDGVRLSAVIYPRALLRKLKFSKNKVAVFEGRTLMRFNVAVPASFGSDYMELKARLKYQSCNDEVCFPPQTREFRIPVSVK